MRSALSTVAGALCAVSLGSAATLGPPSLYMKADRYRSAVVRIHEVQSEGRLKLQVLEELYGETPDGLVVRASAQTRELIEVGAVYVVAHTDKPRRRSPRWTTDPLGPRILEVPAVGPAVLESSASIRELLRARPPHAPLGDRARLDLVLEQLRRPHEQSRRLVLAELALDAKLRALVVPADLEVLKETLVTGALEPVAHDYLLRAARPMVEVWGSEWLAADCREVIVGHGPELELASALPGLLRTALQLLGEIGVAKDAESVSRHVVSNNPGVGRSALEAVAALDPKMAVTLAERYADDETLHPDTRRWILEFRAARQGGGAK